MAFGKLKVSDLFSFSHEIYPLLKLQYIMETVSVMISFYQINRFVQKCKKHKETRYEVFLCSGATIYKDYGMKRQMP
jgi:sorbitol-specific phosphotransferase system component IIC